MMRRVPIFFLAVLLLFSAVSCVAGQGKEPIASGNPAGSDPASQSASAGTEPLVPDLSSAVALVENGKSNYIIVRSATGGSAEKELAEAVRAAVLERAGVRLPCVTDDSPAAQNSKGFEILVGVTNRAESASARRVLRYRDYSVTVAGNKIILAGEEQYMLPSAADAFLNGLFAKDGALYAAFFGTVAGNYPNGLVEIGGRSLSDYRIVYPASDLLASDTAEQVRLLLRSQTGYELACVADGEAETACEILVGNTNRTESGTVFSNLGENEITMQLCGAKPVLAWVDPLLADSLIRQFSGILLASDKNNCHDFSEMVFRTEIPQSLPEGLTRIGIISFNVLGCGSGKPSCYNRDDLAAAVIRTYMPDIVGLQEFDARWRLEETNLFALLGEPYAEAVCAEALPDRNWNPILYRTDRLELLACGNQLFSQGREWQMAQSYPSDSKWTHHRTITWAVFRVRESGETVIALNMHIHIDAGDTAEQKNAIQASEAAELIAKARELQNAYPNATVFVTGDYNSYVSGPVISAMLENGFSDTYDAAKVKTDVCGFHSEPVLNSETNLYDQAGRAFSGDYRFAIDHCLTAGNPVTVSHYLTITLRDAFLISDHNPLYVRVCLGGES